MDIKKEITAAKRRVHQQIKKQTEVLHDDMMLQLIELKARYKHRLTEQYYYPEQYYP